jgi:L-rhamnose mutarotase
MARLKPDKVDEYYQAHLHVPQEVIEEARECGISNHSCFMRGREVIIYLETASYDRTREAFVDKIATHKWDKWMADLFDPTFGDQADEPWKEVFHME